MSTPFESAPDLSAAQPADAPRTLVWDWPVRVFHGLLALSFAGAYLTAESAHWQWMHVMLGYTMAGLVAFRVLWGLIGTRHARFASFVRSPRQTLAYARGYARSLSQRAEPEHHAGHNPLGALAVVAMLCLAWLVAGTGWWWLGRGGGEGGAGEALHEGAANVMLTVVLIHVAGVALACWHHRENLVAAMVTGYKRAPLKEGIRRSRPVVGALLLIAVLAYWGLQAVQGAGAGAMAGAGVDDDEGHHAATVDGASSARAAPGLPREGHPHERDDD